MSAGIDGGQRFKKSNPCPVCGGGDNDKRGAASRCHGFLSTDGEYAHCSREDRAGSLPMESKTETYAHRLAGSCKCGIAHTPGTPEADTRRAEVIATYDYRDPSGQLVYQALRRADKTFTQRRPDPAGGWIYNLKGVSPTLYRLPELLAADPAATVWVVEGEKDANALAQRGLIATTNSGGAEKWPVDQSHHLAGRRVVILPDNDPKGRKHATQVAAAIGPHAASIRILELPDLPAKGDVSDWLLSGGTPEALVELAARPAPPANIRLLPNAARAPWELDLRRTATGVVKGVPLNAVTVLDRSDDWAGALAWNEHSHRIEHHKKLPWSEHLATATDDRGSWGSIQDDLLVCQLERDLGMTIKASHVRSAARIVAQRNKYHPVRQYLEQIVWDGTPRVATWLMVYLGAEPAAPTVDDDRQSVAYLRDVGQWMLISAVVRAVHPGVKVDEMVIFEGGQGTFKSTACKVLGGEWYVEVDAATLGTTDKDTLMVARTAWILEAGEFDSLSGASFERVKSMVTRAVDTFRVPYGAEVENFARGWIAIGTTNADTYLRDPTGARRFHPVKVGRVDIPALQRDRDQLWAEAYHLQQAGALHYPTGDTSVLRAEQAKRFQVDAWQERIDAYLATRPPEAMVTTPDILHDALKLDPKDMNRTAEMRAASCLKIAKWVKGPRCHRAGILIHPWRRPDRVPGEEG